MEAILEADVARHIREERGAAHAPRRAACRRWCTARRPRARASEATPIAVEPKALLKILHSESGANTLDLAEAGRRRRRAGAGQGVPARSGDARRCCTPISTASAMDRVLQVTIPVVVKGEPKGVKQQGGILEFIRREIEIECLPGDIPEHVEIDVSELMLHQGVRVRDIADGSEVEAAQRPRHDARARDHAEGRGGRGAGRGRGGGAGRGGRARGHQEGQEGRGRGREEETSKKK